MIVYKYGALKPISGFEQMLEALRHANRFRNSSLELDLARRAAAFVGADPEEIKAAHNAEHKALYKQYVSLIGARTIHYLRAATRKSASTRWKCWSKAGRFRSPFRRFTGTGFLAAGSQHNVKTWATLRPETPEEIQGRHRRPQRDTGRKWICEMRITPTITVSVPIEYDRPLPEDTKLERAVLHVKRDGDKWCYSLDFVITNVAPKPLMTGVGLCTINFGWRSLPEGIRIATCVGPDGKDEYLILPREWIDARKHAESLGGLADKIADEYLGSERKRHRTRREILRGQGPSALSFVPFTATDPSPENDLHWALRDRHLWQWECAERDKMMRRRQEKYRLWSRMIRAKYGSVLIEKYSLAELAKAATTPEVPRKQAARHVRFLAAPSYLRVEIKRVFGDDCKDSNIGKRTKRCHLCRKMCEFDAAEELEHECEHCGGIWDQDVNNAKNQHIATAAE